MTTVTRLKAEINNPNLPILLLESGEVTENYYLGRYLNAVFENGGTLSAAERTAVEDFFDSITDANTYLQIYAFIGDAKAACVPLIDNLHNYEPIHLMNNAVPLESMFHVDTTTGRIDGATGSANDALITSFCLNDIDVSKYNFAIGLGGTFSTLKSLFGVTYNSKYFGFRVTSATTSGKDYLIQNYTGGSSTNGSQAMTNGEFVQFYNRNVASDALGKRVLTINDQQYAASTIGSVSGINIEESVKNRPFAIGAMLADNNGINNPTSMTIKSVVLKKSGTLTKFVKLLHDLGRDN